MRTRIALLVVIALLVGACSGDDDAAVTTTTTSVPAKASLKPGHLADRTAEVLAYVNAGGAVRMEDLFAPSFLAEVSIEQLNQLVETQLRPAGPFEISQVVDETATSAVLLVQGKQALSMSIVIDPDPPYLVSTLFFKPAPVTVASWDELDSTLAAAAPDVAFLAAEVSDGTCTPVHDVDADRVLPIASVFKLYVLGALAEAVDAGTASWDETVPIRDELRVHTSQTYGATPAGTQVSLGDLAAAMIAVSDNTATDHVIDRVGRAAVEAEQAKLGMADPSRNVPFLTTREMSLLKFIVPAGERDAYIAGDEATRYDLLTKLPTGGVSDEQVGAVKPAPTALDSLEWFASPNDLCAAHVGLRALVARPGLEQVRSILSTNPGGTFDEGTWPYVAFKGGSEPGVLTGAWLAERSDGHVFVVVAQLQNANGEIDAGALSKAAAAFGLLAKA